MSDGRMDVVELYRRSVHEFARRLPPRGSEGWSKPTPCTEWDVRALVEHIVSEELWAPPLLAGQTIGEVGDRFDGDLLGDDPLTAARQAADASVEAVEEFGPNRPLVHLSYGEEDSHEYIRQIAADHVVHAWDLAAATGGARVLDHQLVAEVSTWFVEREKLYRDIGSIAGRPDVSANTPQARLLVAFGRNPRWSAKHPSS
jgi:uncharacterized protein (TIGR03086 family)